MGAEHEPSRGVGRGDLLPFVLLAGTFVAMAAISWYRWPEIVIDYGRELYVPWRITAGEMLYADIPHLYGPLAHYANAALFALFGPSLRTLVAFNLLLVGALTALMYAVLRGACGRLAATLCGMTFLGVFAFANTDWMGNWNFVCPYSHEVTYGIFLSFLLVAALERLRSRGSRTVAAVVGLLLGLVFLTKVEVFLAALLTTLVVVALPAVRARSLRGTDAGRLLAGLAGFAAPLALFGAFFASRTTVAAAAGMVAAGFTSLGRAPIVRHAYYLWHSGLDEPLANVLAMLGVAAVYAALFAGVAIFSAFVARRGGADRNRLLLAALVLALCVSAFLFRGRTGWWSLSGRPFPLFVLAYAGLLLWRSARGDAGPDGGHQREGPLVALSVFGLLLLLKIILRTQFTYYGFALAMPATLVVVAVVVHRLPDVVRRAGGCPVTARVLATTLVVLFVALQAEMSRNIYRTMTYPVGRGADRFYTYDERRYANGPIVNEALRVIASEVPADAGFVVIPEGVMLNFLARRRNPGRWFEFTPQFVESMGERRMRDDLEAGRPEFLVLTERRTTEHGARYFGTDYGLILRAWITENYTPIRLIGDKLFSGRGFGIAIARRNGKPSVAGPPATLADGGPRSNASPAREGR